LRVSGRPGDAHDQANNRNQRMSCGATTRRKN
jgi:hypothetical protein